MSYENIHTFPSEYYFAPVLNCVDSAGKFWSGAAAFANHDANICDSYRAEEKPCFAIVDEKLRFIQNASNGPAYLLEFPLVQHNEAFFVALARSLKVVLKNYDKDGTIILEHNFGLYCEGAFRTMFSIKNSNFDIAKYEFAIGESFHKGNGLAIPLTKEVVKDLITVFENFEIFAKVSGKKAFYFE